MQNATAVLANDGVFLDEDLRAADNTEFEYMLMNAAASAMESATINFTANWSGTQDWLDANISDEQKLSVIYYNGQEAAIKNMITGAQTAVDNAQAATSAMSLAEFFDKVNAATLGPIVAAVAWPMSNAYDELTLAEHHIYGSSHLGIQYYDPATTTIKPGIKNTANYITQTTTTPLNTQIPWYHGDYGDIIMPGYRTPWNHWHYMNNLNLNRTLGMRHYSLSDHLGNVLATVLDRKTGHKWPTNNAYYDYWKADVVSATDYYPFGMQMPGRFITGSKYRFGFNGQEKDNEIKGEGNSVNYAVRIQDPRLGRFLSVDPLTQQFPWYSPYQFAGNTPIQAIDLDGAEPLVTNTVAPRITPRLVSTGGPIPSGGAARNPFQPAGPTSSLPIYVNDNNGAGYADLTVKLISNWVNPPKKFRTFTVQDRLNAIKAFNVKFEHGYRQASAPERITNDVNNLSAAETHALIQRLKLGGASMQDLLLAAQLRAQNAMYHINDKHLSGDPDASMLPGNHFQLWDNRVYFDGKNWWSVEGKGKDRVYHRFSNDGNGNFHWSGSTGKNYNRKGAEIEPVTMKKGLKKEIDNAASEKED